MTDTDEIDERRARALCHRQCLDCADTNVCDWWRAELDAARAIRQSDEAAGYILIKHEGIISSEGMKPVEVE